MLFSIFNFEEAQTQVDLDLPRNLTSGCLIHTRTQTVGGESYLYNSTGKPVPMHIKVARACLPSALCQICVSSLASSLASTVMVGGCFGVYFGVNFLLVLALFVASPDSGKVIV